MYLKYILDIRCHGDDQTCTFSRYIIFFFCFSQVVALNSLYFTLSIKELNKCYFLSVESLILF